MNSAKAYTSTRLYPLKQCSTFLQKRVNVVSHAHTHSLTHLLTEMDPALVAQTHAISSPLELLPKPREKSHKWVNSETCVLFYGAVHGRRIYLFLCSLAAVWELTTTAHTNRRRMSINKKKLFEHEQAKGLNRKTKSSTWKWELYSKQTKHHTKKHTHQRMQQQLKTRKKKSTGIIYTQKEDKRKHTIKTQQFPNTHTHTHTLCLYV